MVPITDEQYAWLQYRCVLRGAAEAALIITSSAEDAESWVINFMRTEYPDVSLDKIRADAAQAVQQELADVRRGAVVH